MFVEASAKTVSPVAKDQSSARKLDPHEELKVVLELVLAEIRTLLEQQHASVLKHIAGCVCSDFKEDQIKSAPNSCPRRLHSSATGPQSSIVGVPNVRDGLSGGRSDSVGHLPSIGLLPSISESHAATSQQIIDDLAVDDLRASGLAFMELSTNQIQQISDGTSSAKLTLEEKDARRHELARIVVAKDRSKRSSTSTSDRQPAWIKAKVDSFMKTRNFEIWCACLIFLNSMCIGIEVEVNRDATDRKRHLLFFILQCLFCVAFTLELFMRMISDGMVCFFTSSNTLGWNYLDFCIVVSSLVEITVHIVVLSSSRESTDTGAGKMSNFRIMKVLRMTRFLRALRMGRAVSVFRELRVLLSSIVSTLYTLVWFLVLLLIIIYVFAILFTEGALEVLQNESANNGQYAEVVKFFGTLPESMLTLFKSISGGIDWDTPARALGELNQIMVCLFTIYIAFVYFAMLNVVSGVFCSSAVESSLRDKEHAVHSMIQHSKKWRRSLVSLFRSLDEDQSNELTLDELEVGLQDERVKAYFASLDLDPDDAWTLFKLIDFDQSQKVDVEEFVLGCLRLRGQAKSFDVAKLMYDTRTMAKRQELFMKFVEEQFTRLGIAHQRILACTQNREISPIYASAPHVTKMSL